MIGMVEHEELPRRSPMGIRDPEYFDTNERGPQSEDPPELTEAEQELEEEG